MQQKSWELSLLLMPDSHDTILFVVSMNLSLENIAQATGLSIVKTETSYLSYLNEKRCFPRCLIHNAIAREIDKAVGRFPSGSFLLDAGCGVGNDTERFQRKYNVVGVDYQKTYIDFCRKKYRNAQYSCCSLDNLEFADNLFDIIILNQVIEHIENPKPILFELNRVLKATGSIVICTPNYHSWVWLLVENIWYRFVSKGFDPKTHVSHYHPGNFRQGISPLVPASFKKLYFNSLLFVVGKKK